MCVCVCASNYLSIVLYQIPNPSGLPVNHLIGLTIEPSTHGYQILSYLLPSLPMYPYYYGLTPPLPLFLLSFVLSLTLFSLPSFSPPSFIHLFHDYGPVWNLDFLPSLYNTSFLTTFATEIPKNLSKFLAYTL